MRARLSFANTERASRRMWARVVLLAIAALALTVLGARFWPHDPLPADAEADRIVVSKSERVLSLMRDGAVLKSYAISLGGNPIGHKVQEGDNRTPEGVYRIDGRNAGSSFYRSLHISYPNEQDRARAAALGVSPGGDIVIHGIRNGLGFVGRLHRLSDWTEGCIAVTDQEMAEIWNAVPDYTSIEIRP